MKQQLKAYKAKHQQRPFVRAPFRPKSKSTTIVKVTKGVPRTGGGQFESENAYFDSERTQTNIPAVLTGWTGTEMDPNTSPFLCLFAPVTGNDIFNREGRKIFVKKIHISGQIDLVPLAAQTTAGAGVLVRLVVFQDKQTNTSNTNVAQLVLNSGAASDALHMFMSTANFGRFKIWKDKKYHFYPGDYSGLTTAYVRQGQTMNFNYMLKVNEYVNYNATNGGTVADVIDNSFHMLANSTSASCTINYKVRTVFTA